MSTPSIATAADYADAMFACRRAKNWLVGLLMLTLFSQLAMFLIARFGRVDFAGIARGRLMLEYFIAVTCFAGIVLCLVLAVVLLLIIAIMLVGRLIGVSYLIRAFVTCVILAAMLFPWQIFINVSAQATADFRIPGVLYTWSELANNARFPAAGLANRADFATALLRWSRFVAFPVVAVILLLLVQTRSRHGLRQALGEAMPSGGDDLSEASQQP